MAFIDFELVKAGFSIGIGTGIACAVVIGGGLWLWDAWQSQARRK